MSSINDSLFRILRRMAKGKEVFYYDGDFTAIRLIELTPIVEQRLRITLGKLLDEYRDNFGYCGLQLIWMHYVSQEEPTTSIRYFFVVTLEGNCPTTQADFDQKILNVS